MSTDRPDTAAERRLARRAPTARHRSQPCARLAVRRIAGWAGGMAALGCALALVMPSSAAASGAPPGAVAAAASGAGEPPAQPVSQPQALDAPDWLPWAGPPGEEDISLVGVLLGITPVLAIGAIGLVLVLRRRRRARSGE